MILIKGMEMPTDGTYNIVYIYSDGRVSMPFWGKGMQIVQGINAIPVPPHGRLIDADELIKFIELRYDITWESDNYEGGIKDACTDILERIEKLPTIIPADKDGET